MRVVGAKNEGRRGRNSPKKPPPRSQILGIWAKNFSQINKRPSPNTTAPPPLPRHHYPPPPSPPHPHKPHHRRRPRPQKKKLARSVICKFAKRVRAHSDVLFWANSQNEFLQKIKEKSEEPKKIKGDAEKYENQLVKKTPPKKKMGN